MRLSGFDIGGTKCAVSLGEFDDGNISIIDRMEFATAEGKTPYDVIEHMEKALLELLDKHKWEKHQLHAIGISCGGPLDSKRGVIMSPPNLLGWDNIEIVKKLELDLGINARLQNDANACALAEWMFGAGKGTNNMIFFTFGTGLGAGLILDGKLYSGTNDNAGEAGHIRLSEFGPVGYGKSGSFEGFCSGNGIAQIARTYAMELLQRGKAPAYAKNIDELAAITAKSVAIAAKNGDETAISVYAETGRRLGQGLSIIIDILNPQLIILGGVFMRDSQLLWKYTDEVLKRECLPLAYGVCKVVPAKLSNNIGDYAALAVAADHK